MNKSLDDLIKTSPLPVFVDFWAEWCGHCKMVAPAINQLAEEFSDRLVVVKVNIDEQPELAESCKVRGIPAMMLYRGGEIIWNTAGEMPYVQLKADVTKALGGS